MIIADQIDAQAAHAVLHALRLVFDSMRATEQIEAEFELTKVAAQMAEMREVNEDLYQRLVDLDVAAPISSGKSPSNWKILRGGLRTPGMHRHRRPGRLVPADDALTPH